MTAGSKASQFQLTSSSYQLVILIEGIINYGPCDDDIDDNLSYRHSENMIKRLESAGLGFFVQATETQQKLGIAL